MHVEIVAATIDQQPILANLLELYIHDFSEFIETEIDAIGRFGYPRLPLYWQESGRFPFLILADGRLAGFVFVQKGSQISANQDVWDMTEFFVLRGCRRHGVGIGAAHEVWKKFPGRWEVRIMEKNQAAISFWSRAIADFTGIEVTPSVKEIEGQIRYIFSFETVPD